MNGDPNYTSNGKNNIVVGTWNTVLIEQRRVTGKLMYRVQFNDFVKRNVENTQPQEFENVEAFLSSSAKTADAEYRNLVFHTGPTDELGAFKCGTTQVCLAPPPTTAPCPLAPVGLLAAKAGASFCLHHVLEYEMNFANFGTFDSHEFGIKVATDATFDVFNAIVCDSQGTCDTYDLTFFDKTELVLESTKGVYMDFKTLEVTDW